MLFTNLPFFICVYPKQGKVVRLKGELTPLRLLSKGDLAICTRRGGTRFHYLRKNGDLELKQLSLKMGLKSFLALYILLYMFLWYCMAHTQGESVAQALSHILLCVGWSCFHNWSYLL